MTPSERKPMILVIAGPNGSAKEALEQINSKNYPIAYKNDGRKIVKVGVNYSSEQKQLTEWVIEQKDFDMYAEVHKAFSMARFEK